VVSHNQEQSLSQIILKLRADSIPFDWITVLKPSAMSVPVTLVPQGIRVESIGRYRGMESPIIIIFAASNMSDTEFFCAYSRATSRCIVILDAFDVKQQKYASLGKQVYIEQKQCVETELIKSFSATMIANSTLSFDEAVSGRIHLRWCKQWKAYALDGELSESVRLLAIDYFCRIKTPVIYTWAESSRDCLEIIPQNKDGNPTRVKLKFCQICGALTPHAIPGFEYSRYIFRENLASFFRNTQEENCVACRTVTDSKDIDFEASCAIINDVFDNRRAYTEEQRKCIDPYIFSIGVLIKHGFRHEDKLVAKLISYGAGFGRVAIVLSIFIIYRDYIKNGIVKVKMVDVADSSHHFNTHLEELSFSQWQGFVNGAFANLEKFNAVESIGKGYRKVNEEFFKSIIRAKDEIAHGLPPNKEVGSHC